MRLLVYNIAYGTGAPKSYYHHVRTAHRYLRTSHTHIDEIIEFIRMTDPDIIGLIEVDTGSFRTSYTNQLEKIAEHCRHNHHGSTKYGRHFFVHLIPFFRNQANAILSKEKISRSHLHYFARGFKKLVVEAEIDGISFFLVHLALQRKTREVQLSHLAKLADRRGPVIIAGDFNTFEGESEIAELSAALDLKNPNSRGIPTFPSWKPSKQIDFILCSKEIKVSRFEVPRVSHSDHLPLLLDFKI